MGVCILMDLRKSHLFVIIGQKTLLLGQISLDLYLSKIDLRLF